MVEEVLNHLFQGPYLLIMYLPHNATGWSVYVDRKYVGLIASATWSPDFNTNVAIGMIDAGYWEAGQELIVDTGVGERSARVKDRFWI